MLALALSILPLLLADEPGAVPRASAKSSEGEHARDASETADRQALAQRARANRELAEQKSRQGKGPPIYLGPLGLMWGQTPAEVRAALHDRLTFEREFSGDQGVSFVQRYSGDFGGFRAQTIDATFWEGKLLGVMVVLTEPDPRPQHRRWAAVVDAMSKSYGKPREVAKIPTSSALKIAREAKRVPEINRSATLLESMATEQEDAFLSAEIQAGRWQPSARWDFKNARVLVSVLAEDPDESGVRPTSVTWAFMEWPRFAKWYAAAKKAEGHSRDF